MTPKAAKRTVSPTKKAGRIFQYQPPQDLSVTFTSFRPNETKKKELSSSGKLVASSSTVKPVWEGRHCRSETASVSVKNRGGEKKALNRALPVDSYISRQRRGKKVRGPVSREQSSERNRLFPYLCTALEELFLQKGGQRMP